MANYDKLKYSGITGSSTLATSVETTVEALPSIAQGAATFTASNDITTGQVVVMGEDGNVSRITAESSGAVSTLAIGVGTTNYGFGPYGSISVNPADDTQVLICRSSNVPGHMRVQLATVDNVTNFWYNDGAYVTVMTDSDAYDSRPNIEFIADNVALMSYRTKPTQGNAFRLVTVSGTNITLGTEHIINTFQMESKEIMVNPFDNTKFAFTTGSYDSGWYTDIYTGSVDNKIAYFRANSDGTSTTMRLYTYNNGTLTEDTSSVLTGAKQIMASYYDNGVVVAKRWNSSSKYDLLPIDVSSGSIVTGTVLPILDHGNAAVNNAYLKKIGDSYVVAFYGSYGSGTKYNYAALIMQNGTTLTQDSLHTIGVSSAGSVNVYDMAYYGDTIMYIGNGYGSTCGVGVVKFTMAGASVANFNGGETIVGLVSDTVLSGAPATVVLSGGVVEGLSGLIPGRKYYAHADGTMTVTQGDDGIVVGTALTTTSLKVSI